MWPVKTWYRERATQGRITGDEVAIALSVKVELDTP
jgi:hypothetical protein